MHVYKYACVWIYYTCMYLHRYTCVHKVLQFMLCIHSCIDFTVSNRRNTHMHINIYVCTCRSAHITCAHRSAKNTIPIHVHMYVSTHKTWIHSHTCSCVCQCHDIHKYVHVSDSPFRYMFVCMSVHIKLRKYFNACIYMSVDIKWRRHNHICT